MRPAEARPAGRVLKRTGKAGPGDPGGPCKGTGADEDMEEQVIEAEGLLARCILHECDHLDGKLYVDLVEGALAVVEMGETEE